MTEKIHVQLSVKLRGFLHNYKRQSRGCLQQFLPDVVLHGRLDTLSFHLGVIIQEFQPFD